MIYSIISSELYGNLPSKTVLNLERFFGNEHLIFLKNILILLTFQVKYPSISDML